MINVKLIVLFFSIDIVASSNKYCEICPNHTLCKYSMPGPSSSCKDYVGTPVTKDDVNSIINKINERRNFVALGRSGLPQAANMNKIYWSEELAAIAQRWVDQCDPAMMPDKEDECRDLDDTYVGQSIASVAGPAPGMQLRSMIDVWFMQSLNYKGSVTYYNQSRDWKTGYFTQLIWGETDWVGCGRARFYSDQKKSIIERLVCNFGPRGNIHGKPVYAVGYPATQCQQNKIPDRKFEGLCRYFVQDNKRKFTTSKPGVSSLLRILNLSNKTESRNNLKQVKFDVNETSEQRNQKTRHVLFNNSHAVLKSMPGNGPVQGPWNPTSNYSKNQRLQRYQQDRGHSRVYHGHDVHDNNFGPDYRETTNRNYPTHNFPTTENHPSNYNYRKVMFNDDFTTEQYNSETPKDLRKYNMYHQCTRQHDSGCGMSHEIPQAPCSSCSRVHSGPSCGQPPPPCQNDSPCQMRPRNPCLCNTPTPCATMTPRCPCNENCKCFATPCGTPCAANNPCGGNYRRSDNTENKDETKKPGDLHYYDLLPNMAIRSGDKENEQSAHIAAVSSSQRDDWIQHDTTINDIFERLSPKLKYDHKQVKDTFENKRNNKYDYDYIYDSSHSRERKRRSSADDITFKPFWQMDEFDRGKSTLLKSLKFTTLSNKKVKNARRTNPTIRIMQTTEPITVLMKEVPNLKSNQKNVTEKYLSFDELMHLRKFTSTETKPDIVRNESNDPRYLNLDGRRDAKESGKNKTTTPEYTVNTPFKRNKHCTRKLTCTWTIPTIVAADGSVIIPGMSGDRGSRTPPGYVEGCTRTSTCTRDYMDRNKYSTIPDENGSGSGDGSQEDEDYCEKRSLDVRKRDSHEKANPFSDDQTYTETPSISYTTYTDIAENIESSSETMPTTPSDNCVCEEENLRIKRNERKPRSGNCGHLDNNLSYGDLYYLVLQKFLQKWKNNQNSYYLGACLCNSAVLFRGSISLLLFLFLCNVLIKYIFI